MKRILFVDDQPELSGWSEASDAPLAIEMAKMQFVTSGRGRA